VPAQRCSPLTALQAWRRSGMRAGGVYCARLRSIAGGQWSGEATTTPRRGGDSSAIGLVKTDPRPRRGVFRCLGDGRGTRGCCGLLQLPEG